MKPALSYHSTTIPRQWQQLPQGELMAKAIEQIIALPDPVGATRHIEQRPNGINIEKRRIALGVICMIYEARPNVTADAGAL